ncbi:hypothetical protein VTJ04DRAFT_6914 [Mycothermus thermophilus]|uniref:uncharacterized protein n=1 Tax=Humicola insolens TaxID=85995 RepID=UPI003742721F
MRPSIRRLAAAPRTVSDATRFTANSLHASSKSAAPASPRWTPPRSPSTTSSSAAGAAGSSAVETPEQRVARLREAHRRAKEAQISKFDQFVDKSRRFLDSAHRVTVWGLVGFSVLGFFASVYAAVDMWRYNKKRKAEWIEAQKRLEADELEAARLAYMLGKATEEQIALVEEQIERDRREGKNTSFFANLPPVLEPSKPSSASPSTITSSSSPSTTPSSSSPSSRSTSVTETVTLPPDSQQQEQQQQQPQKQGFWSWLTSSLKREEEGDGPADRRLGWESLSEEDDGAGVRDSDLARAAEERRLEREAREAERRAKLQQQQQQQKEGDGKKKGWW